MTKAKTPRPKQQIKTKAKPKERIITIPFSDTESEEEAANILAKEIPEWDSLDKHERTDLTRLIRASDKSGTPTKIKLARKPDGGGYSIEPAGKCDLLALLKLQETFASNSIDPVNARASELLKYLGSVNADNEGRYNAALSFIESMAPQNQAEALLLVQMYVTHDAAIRSLSMMGSAEWVPQVQTFGNLATKLLRASQAQMETLAKLRRGGEQTIRHVHVDNRGGQAVIAENVQTGGRENGKIDEQSQTTKAVGASATLLSQDPQGNGVPIPSREGATAMQDARRDKSRRA